MHILDMHLVKQLHSIINTMAFSINIKKRAGNFHIRQEPENHQMAMELPGKLPIHELGTGHKERQEGVMAVPKGGVHVPELGVQLHSSLRFAATPEREHNSVVRDEFPVWHGGKDLRSGCRECQARVPSEHGVVGVDTGSGHFGEQPAGVTRAVEEEV
jgi:hypothetical protein